MATALSPAARAETNLAIDSKLPPSESVALGIPKGQIEAAIAKLDAAQANVAAIEALKEGDNVAYIYGRAANKRILSGTVAATKKNEKGAVQLKVEHGTGFDAEFHLIDSTALLFTAEEIEAAQTDIDATVAAAKAAAEDKQQAST